MIKKIRGYLRHHRAAFKLAVQNLACTPLTSSLTFLAIGLCLSLPLSLYLFVKNTQTLTQSFRPNAAASLYLQENTTPAQIQDLKETLTNTAFVRQVHYISPETALAEFQAASNLKEVLQLLPENPLPGVLHLEIDPQTLPHDLAAFKENSARLPHIQKVDFDFEWLEKLNACLVFSTRLAHFLYFFIGLGVILMIGNTLRLTLERHRDEIEVLTLMGATLAYIRRPFLYRGTLYGLLGGLVSVLVINIGIVCLQTPTDALNALFQGLFVLAPLPLDDTLYTLSASALLGWLGAMIAFSQQRYTVLRENKP